MACTIHLKPTRGVALKLALVTGQRIGEVRA